jgi:hypothetical protein
VGGENRLECGDDLRVANADDPRSEWDLGGFELVGFAALAGDQHAELVATHPVRASRARGVAEFGSTSASRASPAGWPNASLYRLKPLGSKRPSTTPHGRRTSVLWPIAQLLERIGIRTKFHLPRKDLIPLIGVADSNSISERT